MDAIVESYYNGQKKQAIEQFSDMDEDDQINFLVDNIVKGTNTKLLCRLMTPLVLGYNHSNSVKYKQALMKKNKQALMKKYKDK